MKTTDYKMTMNQRIEVERLIEQSQQDLESTLARIVCQRDIAIEGAQKQKAESDDQAQWAKDASARMNRMEDAIRAVLAVNIPLPFGLGAQLCNAIEYNEKT